MRLTTAELNELKPDELRDMLTHLLTCFDRQRDFRATARWKYDAIMQKRAEETARDED